jgi:hypothetical protein
MAVHPPEIHDGIAQNEAAAPSGQDLDRRPAIVTGIDLCRQQKNGAQNEIVMIVIK